MRDGRLDRLAEVLVRHCTRVKKDDLVTIVGEPQCLAPVEAIFEEVLRAGGHPSFHAKSEALQEMVLRRGSDEQVRHVSPFEKHRLEHADVLIVLISPRNTRYLGRMDPSRPAMMQAARRELLTMGMQRMADGTQRYVATEIPGNAAAQDADMSLAEYEEFVFRAGFLHLPDPLAAWRALHAEHERAIPYLEKARELRFRAPAGEYGGRRHDGTDLVVDVSGMKWLNQAAATNFPDGELCSGPRGVDGVVNFTFPAVYKGKEADGIRLEFRGGRVANASATKNEQYLHALIAQDEGASIAGEIALGTNYQIREFVKNAFFDEKIGGTFHLALGAGYPQTGNTNQSGLHWDLVCDLRAGGTIHADGQLIQENGRFLFEGWPGR